MAAGGASIRQVSELKSARRPEPSRHTPSNCLSRIHVARREIPMPMGLHVFRIKVQTGLRFILIRRISLVRKPTAATKSPAKKPAARTVRAKAALAPVARGKTPAPAGKAKTPAPVVTLKHIAAEIAEAHEVPKNRAESMLADTVGRLAKHLVKGNKVRIVGLGIFQVKRREARMGRNPQTGEAVKIKAS